MFLPFPLTLALLVLRGFFLILTFFSLQVLALESTL